MTLISVVLDTTMTGEPEKLDPEELAHDACPLVKQDLLFALVVL